MADYSNSLSPLNLTFSFLQIRERVFGRLIIQQNETGVQQQKIEKNCQGFIKALKQAQKHNPKDSQRPVYLTLTPNDLRISPFLTDPHTSRVEATCEVIIKNDSLTRQEQPLGKVYKFKSFKILRAFRKNENKIVLIDLQLEAQSMTVYFQTENKQFICELSVECSEVETRWPQNFQSTRESNYELIQVGKVGQNELSGLSFGEGKDNLWIQIAQQGIFFRTVEKGKYRHESRMNIGSDSGFVFNNLKAKLKNHVFVNLAGHYLLDHLHQILKKKKTGLLFMKIIWDPYSPNKVRYSYLMSRVSTELGYLVKSVECLLCQQMGEEGKED